MCEVVAGYSTMFRNVGLDHAAQIQKVQKYSEKSKVKYFDPGASDRRFARPRTKLELRMASTIGSLAIHDFLQRLSSALSRSFDSKLKM